MKYNNILVLNRSWCPVQIIEYKKAIAELYTDKAHALDLDCVSYDYENWLIFSKKDRHFKSLHTIDNRVCIPEIIVLTKSNKLPRRDIKYSRQSVFDRDNFKCQYCGKRFHRNDLTIDHVYPKSLGGQSMWDNVVACCSKCNSEKGCKTLKESGLKLLKKPAKPKWTSPVSNTHPTNYCKSWIHFLNKVSMDKE